MHIKDFNVLFVLGGVHAGMGRLINIRHHPLLLERALNFNLCVLRLELSKRFKSNLQFGFDPTSRV